MGGGALSRLGPNVYAYPILSLPTLRGGEDSVISVSPKVFFSRHTFKSGVGWGLGRRREEAEERWQVAHRQSGNENVLKETEEGGRRKRRTWRRRRRKRRPWTFCWRLRET